MITKVIILVLAVGIGLGFIDSAEGLVEFKKYKVINSPKVCGDRLCSEVDEQRAQKGLTSRDIPVCGDRLCYDITREETKNFNKSSPYGQFKLGIPLDLIQCRDGQELAIRTTNSLPVCIDSENIEKVREKGWAISEKEQWELFEEFAENRENGIVSSKTIKDFDVTMNITHDEINDQRYLLFEGNGWHTLHNVEITISDEIFSESIRSKTDDRGHLYMPWPIPDEVGGQKYNIFATDGIHTFEIEIPIALKMQ